MKNLSSWYVLISIWCLMIQSLIIIIILSKIERIFVLKVFCTIIAFVSNRFFIKQEKDNIVTTKFSKTLTLGVKINFKKLHVSLSGKTRVDVEFPSSFLHFYLHATIICANRQRIKPRVVYIFSIYIHVQEGQVTRTVRDDAHTRLSSFVERAQESFDYLFFFFVYNSWLLCSFFRREKR